MNAGHAVSHLQFNALAGHVGQLGAVLVEEEARVLVVRVQYARRYHRTVHLGSKFIYWMGI